MNSVVILASGPSLTVEDCETVRQSGGKVIAINMTYQRAPWADVLYACDGHWWAHNITDVRKTFTGELWTQDETASKGYGLHYIKSVRGDGLSRDPEIIHQGFNSGFQAINLAYHWGGRRIVLLGYDMAPSEGKTHWHKPYANMIHTPYEKCIQEFARLAIDLKSEGVEVVNCTRRTALHCFPKGDLQTALA